MSRAALCPRFHRAIELIGRRWTGAILRLLQDGRSGFAELGDAIPDITDRMLSHRLRQLEAEGLILRRVLPEPPIRVDYELTEKGRQLNATLEAVARWAERWITLPEGRSTGKVLMGSARPRASARRTRSARAKQDTSRP